MSFVESPGFSRGEVQISKQQDRLDEIIVRELRQGAEEFKRKEEKREQEQQWANRYERKYR